MRIGVGLWNMRSTVGRPASFRALYRQAVAAGRRCEELGFDSIWLGEHRFWYDGWCPQPLLVAATIAGATQRLRVGTAMHLLPQHDPRRVRTVVETLEALFPGRLELGVALGYRPEEYAGMGLRISERARLMEEALDELDSSPVQDRLWIGGMAEAAVRRAGRRGLGLMLPPTLTATKVSSLVEIQRQAAEEAGRPPGRVGMLRDVWVDPDPEQARRYFLPRLTRHYEEYVTAWWVRDRAGHVDLTRVTPQVERNVSSAFVGTGRQVADQCSPFAAAGVDTLVLQMQFEETAPEVPEALDLVAKDLLPLLEAAAI